jgi:hypothetical protein
MRELHDPRERGHRVAMQCAECTREISTSGPAYPIDSTMTEFRCSTCELARRVKAAVAAPART